MSRKWEIPKLQNRRKRRLNWDDCSSRSAKANSSQYAPSSKQPEQNGLAMWLKGQSACFASAKL
jgi:hypothetical protein